MTQSVLLEGETLSEGAGFPYLTYYRGGSKDRPLIVFIPGGGHLARVAYGHEGANKQDFLDYWLETHGYGLLAASYPSDYRAFERLYPEMSVSDWGSSLASVVATVIAKNGLSPRIVLLGWSMAGKVVGTFAQAARALGLDLTCFISLSATPPLPGISPRHPDGPDGERFTPQGLWDNEGIVPPEFWIEEIEAIGRIEGRMVISQEEYRCSYRCNTPIQLRGEVDRLQGGIRLVSLELAVTDVRPFDYAQFPICAAITPTFPSDARHALTDSISWAFYTSYAILMGVLAGCDYTAMSQAAWSELRELTSSVPQRLTRYVPGGHFFFVGKTGASETARYVEELVLEAEWLKGTLNQFK